MKSLVFAFVMLVTHGAFAERAPLDFSISNLSLKQGQVVYGWEIFSWQDWLKRPTSDALFQKTDYNKGDIEVFEAHAASVVEKPVAYFTESYLHNVENIRKFDPVNRYRPLSAKPFSVETTMSFPPALASVATMARKAAYLQIESAFDYRSRQQILSDSGLQSMLKALDPTDLEPHAVDLQGSLRVNQIADFMSVITVFYKYDESRTLVVCYVAVALKKHLLDNGRRLNVPGLSGRSVLLGESQLFNTSSGIGVGLPQYFQNLFTNTTRQFGR